VKPSGVLDYATAETSIRGNLGLEVIKQLPAKPSTPLASLKKMDAEVRAKGKEFSQRLALDLVKDLPLVLHRIRPWWPDATENNKQSPLVGCYRRPERML
jgi:hypothetical protein